MPTATGEITAEEVTAYGDVLIRLVTEARTAEPARFAGVTSWSTLHGVCDANEFVLEADAETGNDDLDRSVNLFNGCVARVERALWPSLNGWSAEAEAALGVAYRPVIDALHLVTALTFKVTHTGGNVWNLTADLGRGRSVSVADSDGLHLDFDGEALDQWAAVFYDEDDEPANVVAVETDLTCDGALYAVAVALLWTTPDPA